MIKFLKNTGIAFWLQGIAALMACVAAIVSVTANGATVGNEFGANVVIPVLIGVVAFVASAIFGFDFLYLIPAAAYCVALGVIINLGGGTFADKFNNIAYQGGSFELVLFYVCMFVVASVLCAVSCFLDFKRVRGDVR